MVPAKAFKHLKINLRADFPTTHLLASISNDPFIGFQLCNAFLCSYVGSKTPPSVQIFDNFFYFIVVQKTTGVRVIDCERKSAQRNVVKRQKVKQSNHKFIEVYFAAPIRIQDIERSFGKPRFLQTEVSQKFVNVDLPASVTIYQQKDIIQCFNGVGGKF